MDLNVSANSSGESCAKTDFSRDLEEVEMNQRLNHEIAVNKKCNEISTFFDNPESVNESEWTVELQGTPEKKCAQALKP
ncbi:hypothetical protein NPIL_30601 [Nephila pilipes]|uniref:Uncharacterized protein n=1 Tax=Nephila pilipes TaxID=299642 RepID=A0A8X6NPV0_NEPPI|nr:hypothetical protein NPIL_30601 [Nephila pilipes]